VLARAKRRVSGLDTDALYLLRSPRPVRGGRFGFVFSSNPATGPVNTILGHLGIQGGPL